MMPKRKAKAPAKVRAKATKKVRQPKPEPDSRLGKLVRYYFNGWRYGYLDETKDQYAWIRPVGNGTALRKKIFLTDVDSVVDEATGAA